MARAIVLKSIGRRLRAARQRGVTMLEMLAVLAIAAILIVGVAEMTNRSLNDSRDQQVALYQSQLAAAVNGAISLNYGNYLGYAPVGGGSTAMTVADMITHGILPASYATAQNAFGQSFCLLLRQPVTGQLDAMLISTGGTPIADLDLSYIAANSGIGGGLIGTTQPANAVGAYGGWSAPLASWNTGNCQGSVGHLANQLFLNGPGKQSTDFLYRNAVPGRPDLNAMTVPIGLPIYTPGTTCTAPPVGSTGTATATATDASQHLLLCIGGVWTATYWREPVADLAALTALTGSVAGETRATLTYNLPYAWNGTNWAPLAIDDNGALNFPKVIVSGTPCGPGNGVPGASATQLGVDLAGTVYSCISNVWTNSSVILPGPVDSNCQVILQSSSPTPSDYGNCLPPNGSLVWDPKTQTMTNVVMRPVTLTHGGLINTTTYAHMNYAQCGKTGWVGQVTQYLDIEDSSGNALAHTEMQTPGIYDGSAGVSGTLSISVPAGSYSVVIWTNWAAFTGDGVGGNPWYSSYCPAGGAVIINTPMAMGWNVNTVY
jgi:prepilin-type N-terminal cleavage/methylation domain-containing protein